MVPLATVHYTLGLPEAMGKCRRRISARNDPYFASCAETVTQPCRTVDEGKNRSKTTRNPRPICHSLDLRPAYPLMPVGNLRRCNSCDGSQLTAAIICRNKFLDPEGYTNS